MSANELQFGNPWHGPVNAAGYATLPNGTQRWVGVREAGCSLVRFAGLPVPETTPEEAAAGMRWDNYALLSGINARRLYNRIALPGLAWLFRSTSGEVWRLRFKPIGATAGALTVGSTATVNYQVMALRFGVFGAQPSEETVVSSGSIAFPIVFDWGRCLSGFFLTHSPDGSRALLHPICSSYAYTEPEILQTAMYPDYTTQIPNSSAAAIFELAVASGAGSAPPSIESVTAVASGAGMMVRQTPVCTGVPAELFDNLVTGPTSATASFDYDTVWEAQGIFNKVTVSGGYIYPQDGDGVIHNATRTKFVPGPAAVTMAEDSVMVLFGTYAPSGERVIFKQRVEKFSDTYSAVSGDVAAVYDGGGSVIGYTCDLSLQTHSFTTTTYSIVADGAPAATSVSVVVVDNYARSGSGHGETFTPGFIFPTYAFQAAVAAVPNVRNKTVDGNAVYVNGVEVQEHIPENVGIVLFLPTLAGLNFRPASGPATWKKACSPISTYDHGSYTTDSLIWHPVDNTWWPSGSGVTGLV